MINVIYMYPHTMTLYYVYLATSACQMPRGIWNPKWDAIELAQHAIAYMHISANAVCTSELCQM